MSQYDAVTLKSKSILIIAGAPDSILHFRGSLIAALLARGHQVHVAAPNLKNEHAICSELELKNVHTHSITLSRRSLNLFQDLKTVGGFVLLMTRIRPDVVLAYTIKPVIYGMFSAYLTRVPSRFALITGLGYVFQESTSSFFKVISRWMYRIALFDVSRVIFQNPDDEKLFRVEKLFRTSIPSTIVNGSGVDLNYYAVQAQPKNPVFLLMGRFLKAKGIREYVAAARQVKQQHPNVQFLLLGWFDEGPDAIDKKEFEQWVDEGVVHYLERTNDVRTAVASCSVYVLPSYREGTPRSVLEAMAMGRAIITTDAPGCRETVQHGRNGFLVNVQCIDGLVNAFNAFIVDPTLATQMGVVSRQIAEEKYDVHKVNAHMLHAMQC
jgi:glycosyltransferase involved in cell wall biosynthesis